MIKSFCIFSTGYTFVSKNESKLMSLVFLISYIITLYFLCDFILKFIEDEAVLRLIIIIIFVGFDFAYLYFGIGYKKLYQDKQLKKDNFATLITVTLIISIIILTLPNFKYRYFFKSTHFIRFAESPKDSSSWYLLHNNFQKNNGSQETNGINKNDLLKLKQKFKCSALSETERKNEEIFCSTHPEQRNNALFGFMAWNLGDTKVFCPISSINSPQKELKNECIVISGKALQIMPESYISTNTDGINDGNTENTGHDDPAIDIKTDVRFKNDLNVQSNAGLNNFNIQPVLPIQSNAKNMSIQINYGNCNHASRHPDIGYTDKKICQ